MVICITILMVSAGPLHERMTQTAASETKLNNFWDPKLGCSQRLRIVSPRVSNPHVHIQIWGAQLQPCVRGTAQAA